MLVSKYLLRMYEPVEICLHLLGDDVNVLVVCDVRRLYDVDQFDYVFVVEEFCFGRES